MADIANLTAYVNDIPYAVSEFRLDEWHDFPYGIAGYKILFEEEFKQRPARFTASVTIKGIEIAQNNFWNIDVTQNGDVLPRD